ncbi:hypothetical protein OPKNFCMD_2666 [Methylobacterium crusticola]|uniref:Tryptophan-rich sensory protein n=1 Tax=Methylobacterium crusticola TaxID=1697972 RepID=A0ABQ4QYY0_9HYPH|nr:TspO/MBR family protein [Methylobacterium crusticola]GJD49930.1 hypothetical protein OPKNFCMD_2666 [Methylobacterium crusticola]
MPAGQAHDPTEPRRAPRREGLSPTVALLSIGGVLVLSGLISRRTSPDPSHPRIARWYRSLEKPAYTPPDPVFGGVWPVLMLLISAGAYRLMRAPRSPERDQAVALWAATIALVTAYNTILFGRRSLTGATLEGAMVAAAGAAFVARARGVDPAAAATGVPLTLWSVFGDVLTADIARRNPDLDGRDPGRGPATGAAR